jgi:hypothetical protein
MAVVVVHAACNRTLIACDVMGAKVRSLLKASSAGGCFQPGLCHTEAVTTRWSTRAAVSVGVAGAGPPHTVLVC